MRTSYSLLRELELTSCLGTAEKLHQFNTYKSEVEVVVFSNFPGSPGSFSVVDAQPALDCTLWNSGAN